MQLPSLARAPSPDLRLPLVVALVLAVAGALVALPPLLGGALVAGAIVAAAIVIRPRWGFYLLLLSIPVQDLGAAGELTLTNVLFGLTVVAWLAHRAAAREVAPLPRSPVGPCFVIFVAALALSLIVAREFAPAIAALFQWGKALIVYFLALDLLRTRRQALAAVAALLLAGAAEATLGLGQYVLGVGPESFAIGAQFSRAFGSFGRPNSYAGYLEMILPLGLATTVWLWGERRPLAGIKATSDERRTVLTNGQQWVPVARSRSSLILAAGATALIGAALLASFSRGAWLGTLGALAAMLFLAGPRGRGAALAGALTLALFAIVGGVALLPPIIRDRVESITEQGGGADVRTAYVTAENFAILERRAHWEAGLQMFASDRLLGVGLGNFNVRYSEFSVSPTFILSQGHAHNYYIHVAAEAGLIGLGAYLLLLAAIVLSGLHALRATAGRDPLAHALVVGGLGVVVAVAIHNLFENLHVLSLGIQLSTAWALFAVAGRGFIPQGDGTPAREGAEAEHAR